MIKILDTNTFYIGADDLELDLFESQYTRRTVGIIENGSWAPCAGRVMKDADLQALGELADAILL